MKVKDARITILINQQGTTIQLHHGGIHTFAEARLTPDQLSQALSRLGNTECEIDFWPTTVNRVQELDTLEFPIPEGLSLYSKGGPEKLEELARSVTPEGWHCDGYFGKQDSFFTKEGKPWARATIRRWNDEA